IDVDPSEINKNKAAHLPIVSDVGYALKEMLQLLDPASGGCEPPGAAGPLRPPDWLHHVEDWRAAEAVRFAGPADAILPQYAIQRLWQILKERNHLGDTVVTTGVGQHQMWAAQFFPFNAPRHWITSGGLGAMGFGLPAAMGAQAAHPGKTVIDIDGDGSFLVNVQELPCC